MKRFLLGLSLAGSLFGLLGLTACMANIPRLRNPEAIRNVGIYAEVLGVDSEDFDRSLKELSQGNPEVKLVDTKGDVVIKVNVQDKKKTSNPQKWICAYDTKFEAVDKNGKVLASGGKKVEFESPAEPIVCSAARMHLWALILANVGDALANPSAPNPGSPVVPATPREQDKSIPSLHLTPPKLIGPDAGAVPPTPPPAPPPGPPKPPAAPPAP